MPLAAGLYGVLLGLGFTTFILTFAVWALAGVSVALGDPSLGLAVGLAFGVGRTLPVVVLAPFGGGAAHAAMAEQPRILRSLRLADAAALAVVAATLFATPAQAQAVSAAAIGFADPSVDGETLALHRPGGSRRAPRPRRHPVGRGQPPGRGRRPPGLDRERARRRLRPARLPRPRRGQRRRLHHLRRLASGRRALGRLADGPHAPPGRRRAVGRPALSGNLLVYDVDGRIESVDLGTSVRTMLRREARAQLRGLSVVGLELTYIRATYNRQQVRIGRLRPQRVASDQAVYGPTPPRAATQATSRTASPPRATSTSPCGSARPRECRTR